MEEPDANWSTEDVVDIALRCLAMVGLFPAVLVLNIMFTLVLWNGRFRNLIFPQVKYYLTAMSVNSIAISCLTLSCSLYSNMVNCWPFGTLACKAQAILQAAFNQNYCILITLVAFDRLISVSDTELYIRFCSKKMTKAAVYLSMLVSLGSCSAYVSLGDSYGFSHNKLRICELRFQSSKEKVILFCCYYFVPTLVLMYSYGSIFHLMRQSLCQKRQISQSPTTPPTAEKARPSLAEYCPISVKMPNNGYVVGPQDSSPSAGIEAHLKSKAASRGHPCWVAHGDCSDLKSLLRCYNWNRKSPCLLLKSLVDLERKVHYQISKTFVAVSLGFIISVTPWSFTEVILSCTETDVSPLWTFFLSWLGQTYHLMGPLFFWRCHPQFGTAVSTFIREEVLCKRSNCHMYCSEHPSGSPDCPISGGSTFPVEVNSLTILALNRACREATPDIVVSHSTLRSREGPFGISDPGVGLETLGPKAQTLPSKKVIPISSSGYLLRKNWSSAKQSPRIAPKNIMTNLGFLLPLPATTGPTRVRPRSAMSRLQNLGNNEDQGQEIFWGEILERSLSQDSLILKATRTNSRSRHQLHDNSIYKS